MKTFLATIIFTAGFVIVSMGGNTNEQADTATKMDMRGYEITPAATFYENLRNLITAKTGESDIQLLRRFFQEHGIDFDKPKAVVFVGENKKKKDWLFVNVTPDDQRKVERLVIQIRNPQRIPENPFWPPPTAP